MAAPVMRGLTSWFARLQHQRALRSIHALSDFHSIIERERLRVDRNSHQFSLIVFEFDAATAPEGSLARLASLLVRRVRSTDEVGWFDTRRIGVVLPYTPPTGAWKLADEISSKAAATAGGVAPTCIVYTYPSGELTGGHDAPPGDRVPDAWPPSPMGNVRPGSRFERPPGYVAFTSAHENGVCARIRPVESIPPLLVRRLPLWKRAVDVVGASVGLVAFAPLMLTVAILIKLTSKGPIIFEQQRAKECGEPFTFYKFRTMYRDAEARKQALLAQNEQSGPVFKIRKDPRITPIGRFLRQTSIDELPQLWNVLKGDMTLVGPRPPTLDETPKYEPWQWGRLQIKPGLTCFWQVNGRNEIPFREWVRLDIRYSRMCSPLVDLGILAKTVVAVLSRRGAC
jgi:lipopolysaccharide/colanic/teichoic acid biosynthesis glycosyltransferase